jgi:5-methylcytosine-specific restriction endonuclease McrA
MIVDHNKSIPRSFDWNDERLIMYRTLMHRKYGIQSALAYALLFYVTEEKEYESYYYQFRELFPITNDNLIREVVLHDIYNGTTSRTDDIERLIQDNGAEKTNTYSINRSYEATKEAIKLQHFENSLAIHDDKPFVSIEDDIRTSHHYSRISSKLSEHLDLDLDNYVVNEKDFIRESRLDRHYRKQFSYALSRAFDGHCCNCGEGMGQLEFDHFWLPKSKGGNFLMRSTDGYYVNNCIPLCRSCNASKGARDYRDFFDEEYLESIVETSQSINAHINKEMHDFNDPEFSMRAF